MIRPPKFSEVAARHRTNRTPDFITFGDHFLCRFRWCATVLAVGDCGGEYEDLLKEFFPDATQTHRKLHTLTPEWIQQNRNQFTVALIHTGNGDVQLSLFRLLKPVVRIGGLMAVEGVWPAYRSQFEEEQCRWEGTTAIYLSENW